MAAPALLLIDLQCGFNEIDASGLPRNNPQARGNIMRLLEAARAGGAKVVHVRHASTEPDSVFRPDRPGHLPLP